MMAYFLNNAPLQDWQGNFEVQLLVTLSAAVAVESFANPRINLNQFFTNFSNTYGELHGPRRPGDDDNYPIDCLKLSNLAKIGEYFRNPEQYLSNIVSAYQELRDATPTVRQRMNRWTESLVLAGVPLQSYPVTKQLMVFKALLGVSNSLSLLLNTILRIYSPSDTLIEDLELYTNEIIQLANDTSQYRPLGSGYMPICIGIAWAATSGTPKQVEVGRVLADWQTDFENIRWLETAAWLEQRFEVLRLSVSAPRPRHKVDRWMRIDQFRESGDTSAPSSCVLL
ncbi:hypothetical protein PVAG01_07165 [Phlyctema vagabunda]|uniref:Uncharacterized protein n=1 Tax=Phlyctema vagabunda TaxID=108571 RepID=A0ABR4PBN0_9HELO